jgi:CheY-like chemotaxis protein
MTTTDGHEMWRRRLGREPEGLAEPEALETDRERVRYLHIVSRTRLDLLLTLRRQFRDDASVHVMLDRRERDRRRQPRPVAFADRRQTPDRRRPREYWEDIAHHPAVIVPLPPPREHRDDTAPAQAPPHDGVLTPERLLAWLEESRHVVQRILPAVVAERDALRAEVARLAAAHRQIEQEHADVTRRLDQFLAQIGGALEPLRALQQRRRGRLWGRILVADTEPASAAALRDALGSLGHTVKIAVSGREALGLVPAFEPDVVLLDTAVADPPAVEVLDQLRHLAPALPVVVVGAAGQEPETLERLAKGAFDRLARPVSPAAVERVVAAALARRQG